LGWGTVSFLLHLDKHYTPSFRDAPQDAGPESILTMVVMDSGLALCAPRNDGDYRLFGSNRFSNPFQQSA